MTINEALERLKSLHTVNGHKLHVYTELPAVAQTPCMAVKDVTGTYSSTLGESELTVSLVVMVSYADTKVAATKLNELLDYSALPSELVQLGFSPTEFDEKFLYQFGGSTFLGSEITATIESN